MNLAFVKSTEKLTDMPRLAFTWLFGRAGLELLGSLPLPPRLMASWKVPGAGILEGFVGCSVCDRVSFCLELKILLPQSTK